MSNVMQPLPQSHLDWIRDKQYEETAGRSKEELFFFFRQEAAATNTLAQEPLEDKHTSVRKLV